MDPDKRLELYKDMYHFEMERRNALVSSLQLSLGVIALVIGGLAVYVAKPPPFENTMPSVSLYLLGLLGGGCVLGSVCYLARSMIRHEYEYLPTAVEIESHYSEHATAYRRSPLAFTERLLADYAAAAAHNHHINNRRAGFLETANTLLIVGLVTLASSVIPYRTMQPLQPEGIQNGTCISTPSSSDPTPALKKVSPDQE